MNYFTIIQDNNVLMHNQHEPKLISISNLPDININQLTTNNM